MFENFILFQLIGIIYFLIPFSQILSYIATNSTYPQISCQLVLLKKLNLQSYMLTYTELQCRQFWPSYYFWYSLAGISKKFEIIVTNHGGRSRTKK